MNKNYFTCVFDVGDIRFRVSKDMRIPKYKKETALAFHTHGEYEMFFVEKSGQILMTKNGEIKFPYGSIVVVPPKYTHYFLNNVSTIIFSFEKKNKEQDKNYNTLKKIISEDDVTAIEGLATSYWIWEELKDSFKLLLNGDDVRIKAVLQLLFIKLIQTSEYIKNKNGANMTNASHLFVIDNFINDNLERAITLKDLADELFLSERQVSRIIGKNYGTTFSKLIQEKRLVKAETLLATDKPISEICSLAGFISESSFFATFKKKHGCTPNRFRKIQQIIKK